MGFYMEKYLEIFSELEESERALFFQFASRISDLFDDVSRYDINIRNETFEKETKLQCYEFIMDSMKESLESAETIPEVLLILKSSLILLYKGYNHCKECESIYGDLLQHFKDSLASLFNKMREFQEALDSKFLKIFHPKLHSDWFYLLKPVICELNKLCELVFILDYGIGIHLYKTLIKLFETYDNMGYVDLQIDPILNGLFSEIKDMGDEFKLEIKNTDEVPVHESRMFLFKLNVVKKILKMFPIFIKENLQSTINLVLHLYELLISCCQKLTEEDVGKCLKNILVENISPMLSLFYSEKVFQTSVLLLNSTEISSNLQMPHLLLKLSALNFLQTSSDYHKLPERKDVIKNIFLMLGENTPRDDMLFVSLKLPLSLFNLSKQLLTLHQSSEHGPEPESVTLYQHAYLHISEYAKGISDYDLPNLESFVVDFLKSNSSIPASLLISDVWIFRLRCGSLENLFTRCVSFSQKLSDLPSNSTAKLLFKRMVKFLPLHLKEQMTEQGEQTKDLDDQDRILHRYGAPKLSSASQNSKNIFSGNISTLLDELKRQDFIDNKQLIRRACHILELFTVSINVLEIQEFLRFAEFATLMFKTDIYEIQIAVLTFLSALNFKKFNDKDPLFAKVRSSLAVLYNEALTSKNYIVRLEAFSIFHIMAQFTEIRITQETIAKFPELYPGVKAHLTETPQSGFLTSKDKNELLEKQVSSFDGKPEQSNYLSDQSKSVLSLLKPS
ncbi:unnamed protein product [Larinioides sclopetarius]